MTNSASWPKSGSHPDASTLLLHLEGELEESLRDEVSAHLQDCWLCRAECQRLNQGMYNFVDYWERTVEPSAVQPPGGGAFHRRLGEFAAQEPGHSANAVLGNLKRLLRAGLPGRFGWIPGLVSAAGFGVFVLVSITEPVPVSAQQVLLRASQFQQAVPKDGRIIHQRVRIRVAGRSLDREIYFGSAARAASQTVDPSLAAALHDAQADWSDPLNAASYAALRDSRVRKRDTVTESPGGYTLTTEFGDGGPIHLASLTVRREDWRPVAKRVEFRDRRHSRLPRLCTN